jgi:hypothetical protein
MPTRLRIRKAAPARRQERRPAPHVEPNVSRCECYERTNSASVQPLLRSYPSSVATFKSPTGVAHRRRAANMRQRVATSQFLQRSLGNAYVARAIESQFGSNNTPEIQRVSLNPLDWASDLLKSITGDADRDQAQVQKDANDQAGQLQDKSSARSDELQNRSETEGASLGGDAATQGAQLDAQSDSQAQRLQSQASAERNQLGSESSTSSAAIQQEATGTSTRLQSDVGSLDAQTRAGVNEATGAMEGDASGVRGQSDSADTQARTQWTGLDAKAGAGVKAATDQTQALVQSKTALIREYQSPSVHNPEQFQTRWKELQGRVTAAEHGESALHQPEGTGQAINTQASGFWSKIAHRAQSLVGKATSLASSAWSTLQSRWSALQNAAAGALAKVSQFATAAVNKVKNMATTAWNKLQNLANQVSSRLKDLAERAWTGLKTRGTAVWTALQAAATAAWTALQSLAGSIVSSLENNVAAIIRRINGAVGRIIEFLASAVSSLLSRVRSATDGALGFLKTRASAAWNAVRDVGTRAWQGLKGVAERAWDGLKDLGSRAWARLKEIGSRVWNVLKDWGTKLWKELQNLAKHAWDMLKRAWEWLKQKAEAAWRWVKEAWEALKRMAAKLWEWIKAKARAAWEWLKRKWEWLKAMIRRAIAWLKAKWRWLKSIVKITIRLPDITLVKQIPFKPWKFVDLDSGRIPFVKGIVNTPIGPVELALFARAQAEATVGGFICPCTLKNTRITLQPLISRYTGQTELHIPGEAQEKLVLTGTIGGSANLGGAVGIAEGGLQATGTALAFGSLVISPRIVYDSGKLSFSQRFRLEFCLKPTISLDAFARLVATTAAPPSSGGGGGPTPILPPGPRPRPGLPGVAITPGVAAGPAAGKKPPEKVLWEGRWHIGSISRLECWNLGAKFTLTFDHGVPELDVAFDAKRASVGEVLRSIIAGLVLPPGPVKPPVLPPRPTPGGDGTGPVPVPTVSKNCTADDSCSNDIDSPQRGRKPIVDDQPRNVNILDSKHTRMAKKNLNRLEQLATSTRCGGFSQQCEKDFCVGAKDPQTDCKSQIDSATRSLSRYRELILLAFKKANEGGEKPPQSGNWSVKHTADSPIGFDMNAKLITTKYTVHVTVQNGGKDFNATHLFPGHGTE